MHCEQTKHFLYDDGIYYVNQLSSEYLLQELNKDNNKV
jgi:hypothetical protein